VVTDCKCDMYEPGHLVVCYGLGRGGRGRRTP